MKKVLILMVLLFLIVLGTAGVKAQVRIGGNTPPNTAAVLDLNAAEGTTAGTKGLALPRVTLGSNTVTLDGKTANINGMLVYNTGGTLSTGVYYWNGSSWMKALNNTFFDGDSVVGNEVLNATPGRGLVRAGLGTSASSYTLGIAPAGVDTTMLASLADSLSTFMYYGGKWRTVKYVQIPSDTFFNVTPNSSHFFTVKTAGCLTATTDIIWGGDSTYAAGWVAQSSFYGYNRLGVATTAGTFVLHSYCWRLN